VVAFCLKRSAKVIYFIASSRKENILMKKKLILLASMAMVMASCSFGQKPTDSKSSASTSVVAGTNVKVETIDGKTAYRMDIADASGWNNDEDPMEGKPDKEGKPTEDSAS